MCWFSLPALSACKNDPSGEDSQQVESDLLAFLSGLTVPCFLFNEFFLKGIVYFVYFDLIKYPYVVRDRTLKVDSVFFHCLLTIL